MSYVATVKTIGGGILTGTSLALNSGNIVLTGSLSITSPSAHTPQYIAASATTATIPLGHLDAGLSVT